MSSEAASARCVALEGDKSEVEARLALASQRADGLAATLELDLNPVGQVDRQHVERDLIRVT